MSTHITNSSQRPLTGKRLRNSPFHQPLWQTRGYKSEAAFKEDSLLIKASRERRNTD